MKSLKDPKDIVKIIITFIKDSMYDCVFDKKIILSRYCCSYTNFRSLVIGLNVSRY